MSTRFQRSTRATADPAGLLVVCTLCSAHPLRLAGHSRTPCVGAPNWRGRAEVPAEQVASSARTLVFDRQDRRRGEMAAMSTCRRIGIRCARTARRTLCLPAEPTSEGRRPGQRKPRATAVRRTIQTRRTRQQRPGRAPSSPGRRTARPPSCLTEGEADQGAGHRRSRSTSCSASWPTRPPTTSTMHNSTCSGGSTARAAGDTNVGHPHERHAQRPAAAGPGGAATAQAEASAITPPAISAAPARRSPRSRLAEQPPAEQGGEQHRHLARRRDVRQRRHRHRVQHHHVGHRRQHGADQRVAPLRAPGAATKPARSRHWPGSRKGSAQQVRQPVEQRSATSASP